MPFTRKRRFKRRPRRRRKMPIVKLIKKVIQNSAEHKYLDTDHVTASLVLVNPTIINLQNVAEGTSNNNRIGNNIKISMIRIRYNVSLFNSGASHNVRVYVTQSMADGTPQDLPNVLELYPPLEVSKINYRILYDRTHQLSLGIAENKFVDIRIRGRKMIPVSFDGTSGGTNKGAFNITFTTDNTTADEVGISFEARTYFTDI